MKFLTIISEKIQKVYLSRQISSEKAKHIQAATSYSDLLPNSII